MTESDSYKLYNGTILTNVPTDNLQDLESKTFYVGNKGDEIADYSLNYTTKTQGTDSVLKDESFFFYDGGAAGNVRASAASTTAAMTESDSYKLYGATMADIPTEPLANLESQTFYVGNKGDEIANYSLNSQIDCQKFLLSS